MIVAKVSIDLKVKKRIKFIPSVSQQNGGLFHLSARHNDISVILILAALIPLSMAETERSFSFVKLICTKIMNSMTRDTLSNCMRICQFCELNNEDYQGIP